MLRRGLATCPPCKVFLFRHEVRASVVYFYFLLRFTAVLSQWDFSHGKFGSLFLVGKPASTESRYPTYCACWVFYCLHNPPNSDMDYRIFNVHTDVNACDYTLGCTDTHKRVCTESWLGEKSHAAPGNGTCVSSVPVWCSNQLSCIPILGTKSLFDTGCFVEKQWVYRDLRLCPTYEVLFQDVKWKSCVDA